MYRRDNKEMKINTEQQTRKYEISGIILTKI
jgi:hypothetical protein